MVAACVSVLAGASLLGARLPVRADLPDTPTATGLDYSSAFPGVVPRLSETFVDRTLGEPTTQPRSTATDGAEERAVARPVEIDETPPGANDEYADAVRITRTPWTGRTDASSSTRESGEPVPPPDCGLADRTVWYRFTSPRDGIAFANTLGSAADTILAIYEGSSLEKLRIVACRDNDSERRLVSRLTFRARRGVEYSFQVGLTPTAVGGAITFNLALSSMPADRVTEARDITEIPFEERTSNVGAGVEAGEDVTCDREFGQGEADVMAGTIWYRYRPAADGVVTVDTAPSETDTMLAAYSGAPGALRYIGCNDDFSYDWAQLTFSVEAGTTYYLQVGTRSDAPPDEIVFSVTPKPRPAHDAFHRPALIESLPFRGRWTAFGSEREAGEPDACGPTHATHWYRFTAPETMAVSALAPYGGPLAVYSGKAFGDLILVDCHGGGWVASAVTFGARAGATYLFQLGTPVAASSWDNWLILRAAEPPPNDAVRSATIIHAFPFQDRTSTTHATLDPGEPVPSCRAMAGTLWYRFDATDIGVLSARAYPDSTQSRAATPARRAAGMPEVGFPPAVAVYEGPAPAGAGIGCAEDLDGEAGYAEVRFLTLPGRTYWIQAGGAVRSPGPSRGSICVEVGPPREAPAGVVTAPCPGLRGT